MKLVVSSEGMIFRRATAADADLLLKWRNDPQTRRFSKNTKKIGTEEHAKWLKASLKNRGKELYIAEYEGTLVGTVRIDWSDKVAELSWTVAPEARRKGIGRKMVVTFAKKISGPISAEIKTGNEASKRMAEHAGMKFQKNVNGIMHYARPAIRDCEGNKKVHKYKTDQENFWAGKFGDGYIGRNNNSQLLTSNTVLFSKILDGTSGVKSILEFGANIGLNLIAIKRLLPNVETSGVEINREAAKYLRKNINKGKVYRQSILDYKIDYKRDLVFTKGVLIHLNPEVLPTVYKKMYRASKKYILVAEYYNPTPVEVEYRGNKGFLFKRDFAGELLEMFTDLKLVNYGFAYARDNNFSDGDISWFLLEKISIK